MLNHKIKLQVNDSEYRMIVGALVRLRNRLLAEGKCAEPVDELLLKLCA